MKQYDIKNNTISLNVKKSNIIIRSITYFFALVSFTAPISTIFYAISTGNRFHIAYLFNFIFFGLIGFYLLRISLWNTYGSEKIELKKDEIYYEANYGWFVDAKKSIKIENANYEIRTIGYEEDKLGVLVIGNEIEEIESVVKIPIIEIEKLISQISDL